ncbi:hypothetical protein EVAR_15883_1 [Eumeta japonica]|uniref:Uncharacterized protein n=1 Tax=Eumeta variegata TaxID=151549 RepID=A0A4C1UEY5_EUMVA|nr:hypothetical protein EVAR_15883_1 [Eumeta japonica]
MAGLEYSGMYTCNSTENQLLKNNIPYHPTSRLSGEWLLVTRGNEYHTMFQRHHIISYQLGERLKLAVIDFAFRPLHPNSEASLFRISISSNIISHLLSRRRYVTKLFDPGDPDQKRNDITSAFASGYCVNKLFIRHLCDTSHLKPTRVASPPDTAFIRPRSSHPAEFRTSFFVPRQRREEIITTKDVILPPIARGQRARASWTCFPKLRELPQKKGEGNGAPSTSSRRGARGTLTVDVRSRDLPDAADEVGATLECT